jgi:hypothetical protein
MSSTDAPSPKPEEDEGGGLAGTVLIGALVLVFVIAIVALIFFSVAG